MSSDLDETETALIVRAQAAGAAYLQFECRIDRFLSDRETPLTLSWCCAAGVPGAEKGHENTNELAATRFGRTRMEALTRLVEAIEKKRSR